MAATKGNAPDILTRGLKEVFSSSYDEPTLVYPTLFHVVQSDKDYEEFLSFAGFGYFPSEGEMEVVQLQEAKLGYKTRITPVRFGLGFEVSNELVDDEKYGWIGSLSGELGQALRSTKEKAGADLLNNGFSAAFPIADGKALFATDHPMVRGGTNSNRLATDSDLSYSALQSMTLLLRKTTNDAGIPRPIAGALTLWVPPESEFAAAELLKSVGRPDTANRADNVLTKQRRWDLQVWDYLSVGAGAFYVSAEKRLHRAIYIDRMASRQWVKVDEETYSTKHIVRSRFKVGAADYRGIAGTPGAP